MAAQELEQERRAKQSARANDVVSHATLLEIKAFLTAKIQENQLSTPEIHEFVAQRLTEQQQRRHLPPLLQLLSECFTQAARARGDADLSLDVQSGLCLLEQSFLSAGRVSPLQDMYTDEEEALLDQLALSQTSSVDTAA
ncbi:hypothetical protein PybrP1_006734 [[Pythium] brassicae (nom. inval.)]|nr:hypothetical protein PybrP1_006734 [[Pythium] brassicae (nom. inval.)]